MKFLCVKCDEKMTLKSGQASEDKSVSLVFICGKCFSEIAMLANPMEAQMVKGLGVKVGGRTEPYKPMENLSDMLMENDSLCNGDGSLTWMPSAEERLYKVPEMARPMAKSAIERNAREKGINTITPEFMDEVRNSM